MNQVNANNRIAINTVMLYIRMLLVMGISLYTSRIVLATLGISDYGVYNAVGSVVTMFIFVRSAMGNATNRYIAFAIGQGDSNRLKTIFTTCVIVHTIIAVLIILLCETIGLWLLHYKMVIPEGRETAAFWVFQLSIATCVLGVISVPYDAEIIAHEKMSAFAFLSIAEVILKLVAVFVLVKITSDKLIVYAFFLFIIQFLNRLFYVVYCRVHFKETKIHYIWDSSLIKEMFSFAGWNIIGNMAAIGCAPIINVLLNMFFGPIVNAARGVAVQVQGAVKSFISNFQLAIVPQITKSYACGDLDRTRLLVVTGSKISFYLFLCMALPICIEAEQILALWLVEVPEHTVVFLRLVMLTMLIETLEQPLHTANLATGSIKLFQSVKGLSLFSMIPISYIALRLGAPSEAVFLIQFIVTFLSLCLQLIILRPQISLSLKEYSMAVFFRPFIVSLLSIPVPFILHRYLPSSFISLIMKIALAATIVMVNVYLFGLTGKERNHIITRVKTMIRKK